MTSVGRKESTKNQGDSSLSAKNIVKQCGESLRMVEGGATSIFLDI